MCDTCTPPTSRVFRALLMTWKRYQRLELSPPHTYTHLHLLTPLPLPTHTHLVLPSLLHLPPSFELLLLFPCSLCLQIVCSFFLLCTTKEQAALTTRYTHTYCASCGMCGNGLVGLLIHYKCKHLTTVQHNTMLTIDFR